jgi:hypothetical protein
MKIRDIGSSNLNFASEQDQIKSVVKNWMTIEYIENPSEAVQLAAIAHNGYAIGHIKNPTENVQIMAVKNQGYLLRNIIKNGIVPSVDAQIAAVEQYPYAIDFIINNQIPVAPQLKRVIIKKILYNINEKKYGTATELYSLLEKTKWPELETIGKHLKDKGHIYEAVNYSDEHDQLAAVNRDAQAIDWIIDSGINPSKRVQLASVTRFPKSVQYIKSPDEDVQLAALAHNGYAIKYISHPTENVQIFAINDNIFNIEYIKSSLITKKVKRFVLEKLISMTQSRDNVPPNYHYAKEFYITLKLKNLDWPELELIGRNLKDKNIIEESDLDSVSEKEQIRLIEKNWENFLDITDPSENVQIAAVKANNRIIEYAHITNENVLLFAIDQDFMNLLYIEKTHNIWKTPQLKRLLLKKLMKFINEDRGYWLGLNSLSLSLNLYMLLREKDIHWPELDTIEKYFKSISLL